MIQLLLMSSMNISSFKNFLKKISIFFCLLNISMMDHKISSGAIDEEKLIRTINNAVKESVNKGFIYEIALHAAKELVGKFIDKGFNWLFDLFYNYQQSLANQKGMEELDVAEQGLVYTLDVENALKTYQESIIRNLVNGSPLFNLLLVGPAGTGKTTGATRIARYIEAELKKLGNSINLNGVKLFVFQGGSIFAKGVNEATKTLLQNIERWKEDSQNNLVFIILDEMEVLFPDREAAGNSDKNDLVTTFLSFTGNAKKNIIIVGATNHESALDSAVRRRFTQVIQVKAPDTQARIKILKIDIDYYLKLAPELISALNIEYNTPQLLYIAERLVSMSGADLDNLVKRSVEAAQSGLGFLCWFHLIENTRDEIFKKATFSRKLSEDKKNELDRILHHNITATWFNYINPYCEMTKIGINYEELIIQSYSSIFFNMNYDIYTSLVNYAMTQFIVTKGVSYHRLQSIYLLSNNNYITHKYFNFSINFKGDLLEDMAKQSTALSLGLDQSLCKEVPHRNYYMNNIPKEKGEVAFFNNNHKLKLNNLVQRGKNINTVFDSSNNGSTIALKKTNMKKN